MGTSNFSQVGISKKIGLNVFYMKKKISSEGQSESFQAIGQS